MIYNIPSILVTRMRQLYNSSRASWHPGGVSVAGLVDFLLTKIQRQKNLIEVLQKRAAILDQYEDCVLTTWSFPENVAKLPSAALGLGGEVGEILNVMMKCQRGDFSEDCFLPGGDRHEWLKGELGGVMWFWIAVCAQADLDPREVMEANIAKIYDRQQRGVIKGDGDDR